MITQPLIVAYGMGVDSTAMLVAMQRHGIRPDLILFANTGGEKLETIAYRPHIDQWLARAGFPPITEVKYVPVRAKYHTLEAKCHDNETLPALAYGGHSCSLVFKAGPQDKFIRSWAPAQEAWKAGFPVLRCIGYDDSPQDRKRRARADKYVAAMAATGKAPKYANVYPLQDWKYPLQEWGMTRTECVAIIESAGLPVPMKSACFYCPASKKSEIVWLRDNHPDMFARAIRIEEIARNGKNGFTSVKGLGRNFAWSSLAEIKPEDVVDQATTLQP